MSNRLSAVPHGESSPSGGIFRKTAALLQVFNGSALGYFRFNPFSAAQNSQQDSAPGKSVPQTSPPPPKQPVAPGTLRLEFSKAADYGKIRDFLDPARKQAIDPKSYVVRREEPILRAAASQGGGAFLRNDQDEIAAMTMAYKMHQDGDSAKPAEYTEIGSTLSALSRYSSAQLVVAAAALKQWWDDPPQHMLVTEIDPHNDASLKTYSFYLGWRPISDQTLTKDLFARANATIDPADRDENAIWFHCDDSVITHQARILLTFMDDGGLTHKTTHKHIPVDFSALDDIGLNHQRLHALANGETSRAKLKKIAP